MEYKQRIVIRDTLFAMERSGIANNVPVYLMFAKIPLKINWFLANMGRARARASQIYCVIRPKERSVVEASAET